MQAKVSKQTVHRNKTSGPVSEGDLDAFSSSWNQKKRKRVIAEPENLTWAGSGWNEYAKCPSARYLAADMHLTCFVYAVLQKRVCCQMQAILAEVTRLHRKQLPKLRCQFPPQSALQNRASFNVAHRLACTLYDSVVCYTQGMHTQKQ